MLVCKPGHPWVCSVADSGYPEQLGAQHTDVPLVDQGLLSALGQLRVGPPNFAGLQFSPHAHQALFSRAIPRCRSFSGPPGSLSRQPPVRSFSAPAFLLLRYYGYTQFLKQCMRGELHMIARRVLSSAHD